VSHNLLLLLFISLPVIQVLEQVEGGDLILNRGNEFRPKSEGQGRNLNIVDSYETALKVAQVGVAPFIIWNVN
jgi:hypothetical protein